MIEFDNVSKIINSKMILSSVTAHICEGSRVYILGRSGSGKSQFLRHCTGMATPDNGTVYFMAKDVSRLSSTDLINIRGSCPLVLQTPAVLDNLNIRDNIEFPLRNSSFKSNAVIKMTVSRVAASLNLTSDDLCQMPSTVSPGVLKLACIARALALDPIGIILDEPATGLGHPLKKLIYSLIYNLNIKQGVTTVVASHDPEAALTYASHIIFIEKGELVFAGPVEEVSETTHPTIINFFRNKING